MSESHLVNVKLYRILIVRHVTILEIKIHVCVPNFIKIR